MGEILSILSIVWTVFSLVKVPYYEQDHFYYYNNAAQRVGFNVQNKVFVSIKHEKEVEKFIKDANFIDLHVASYTLQSGPHMAGYVFAADTLKATVELLQKFKELSIEAHPVVVWNQVECIPNNYLTIKAKPFVTETLLKRRLAENGKLTINRIFQNKDVFEIEVSSFLPPNIFVVANMLSEDSGWFYWAQAGLLPLNTPILARMEVATTANTDISVWRELNLIIDIFDPKIKLRMDLLPILGKGDFKPQTIPAKSDLWGEYGKPTIKEITELNRRTVIITYPFRYMVPEEIHISGAGVSYGDKKIEMVAAPSLRYRNFSLIENTNIQDIQPSETFSVSLSNLQDQVSDLIWLYRISGFLGLFGFLILFVLVAWKVGSLEPSEAENNELNVLVDKINSFVPSGNCFVDCRNLKILFDEGLRIKYGSARPIDAKDFPEGTKRELNSILHVLNAIYCKHYFLSNEIVKMVHEKAVNFLNV